MNQCTALAVAGFTIMYFSVLQDAGVHSTEKHADQSLKLVIRADKDNYNVGEPIELQVTLTNAGKNTIFIGQRIDRLDWLYSLQVHLLDEQGRSSPELHWSHPFMPNYDPSEPLVNALARDWMALPPGYFMARHSS